MKTIKCPKCNGDVVLNIAKCVDENGEVYKCPKCGFPIRYVEK